VSDWVTVCHVADLPPGAHRVVEVDGAQVAVFNLEGELYAIEGNQIVCPRHGARFCIKTGEALTPPAFEPTATFPVRVENDEVQVRDERWD
jgi:3-phenylpropionate/trans-cinnamate dioxygenase ferredoxin subunit